MEKEAAKTEFLNSLKKKYPLWNAEVTESPIEQKQANLPGTLKKQQQAVS